jgi:DNA helicase-2/ATP-dependent DNA helicase PcrA
LFPVSRSLDEPEAVEEERRLFYVGLTRAIDKVYMYWAQSRRSYQEMSYRLPSRFLDELEPGVIHTVKPVHTSYARSRFTQGPKASRRDAFIENGIEYESAQPENELLKPGVWVSHEVFGKGQVIQLENNGIKQKVSIRFKNGVEKKFLTHYARFTVLL